MGNPATLAFNLQKSRTKARGQKGFVVSVERAERMSKEWDKLISTIVAADEVRRLIAAKMEWIDHNVRTCLCETCLAIQWFDATRSKGNKNGTTNAAVAREQGHTVTGDGS